MLSGWFGGRMSRVLIQTTPEKFPKLSGESTREYRDRLMSPLTKFC